MVTRDRKPLDIALAHMREGLMRVPMATQLTRDPAFLCGCRPGLEVSFLYLQSICVPWYTL